MVTGLHFLLSYACTHECDHCFLHCSPSAGRVFTVEKLRRVFDEIPKIGTIKSVYFEGGEPFLFYPLLVEGMRMAGRLGLKIGVVTNGYWATGIEDAKIWLEPLRETGVADLSVSDDQFHGSGEADSPAKYAYAAARELGIPSETICIGQPAVSNEPVAEGDKGKPVVGGGVRFRGRAAEKLTGDLPRARTSDLTRCPDEDLETPGRLHLDALGTVHICQGVSMGNMWETPLAELIRNYDPMAHPICGPLLRGGPAALAAEHGVAVGDEFVDECHCCYSVRKVLVERFPEQLAPRLVYGLE